MNITTGVPRPVPAVPCLRPDHLQVPDPQGDQEEVGGALRRRAAQGGHLQAVRHTVDLRHRLLNTGNIRYKWELHAE